MERARTGSGSGYAVNLDLDPVASWPTDAVPATPVRLDDGEHPTMGDPAFPVRHGGDLLGAIAVAPAAVETRDRAPVDRSVPAKQACVLRNVGVVVEIQRSRQRIVSSQDEARRRLEREGHDGAQQRLVTAPCPSICGWHGIARKRAAIQTSRRASEPPSKSSAHFARGAARADSSGSPPGDPHAERRRRGLRSLGGVHGARRGPACERY